MQFLDLSLIVCGKVRISPYSAHAPTTVFLGTRNSMKINRKIRGTEDEVLHYLEVVKDD